MEAKHTRGPWDVTGEVRLVGDANTEGAWNLYCADVNPVTESEKYLGTICNIQSADHVNGISREEAEANARLIAAAPDLLQALRELAEAADMDARDLPVHEHETILYEARRRALKAIAKAEGAQ